MRTEFICGDSIDEEVETFDSAGNEYSGADGWSATFRFVPRTAGVGQIFDIACNWTGDAFRYQVAASTSAVWIPAEYSWSLIVAKPGLRVTLETGSATVRPDPENVASYDARSAAQRGLDDAKAALTVFNTSGGRVRSYSIAGRAMEFESGTEITSVIDSLQIEVNREKRRDAISRGLGDPNRILVRF